MRLSCILQGIPRVYEQRAVTAQIQTHRQHMLHDGAKNGSAKYSHLSLQQGDSQVAV